MTTTPDLEAAVAALDEAEATRVGRGLFRVAHLEVDRGHARAAAVMQAAGALVLEHADAQRRTLDALADDLDDGGEGALVDEDDAPG